MSRQKKIKKVEVEQKEKAVEVAPETKPVQAEKPLNMPIKEVLIKSLSRTVTAKLIENRFEVVHISGNGQSGTPKVFYLKGLGDFKKFTPDEMEYIIPAEYVEISKKIGLSAERVEEDRKRSMAQKRLKGAPIQPSEFH